MKRLPWMSLSLALLVAACDSDGEEVPGVVNTGDGGVDLRPVGDGAPPVADLRGQESGTCQTDGGADCWQSLEPLPSQPRFYVGVAGARNKVFVVGGFNDGDAIAVHAFDIAAGTWAPLARLPGPFKMPNVAAVGAPGAERLLVLGGMGNNTTVEYDFASDSWKPLAPAPVEQGRGAAAVGVHGTRVLLAGGVLRGPAPSLLNAGKRAADLLAYDTQMDKWEQLMSMPQATGYAMGAVLGDELWVMGGSTDFVRTDQVRVYDLTAGTWGTRTPLPRDLSSAAVAILKGRVYLSGGIATSVGMISADCLVLNPTDWSWSTVAPLTTARFGMGAAVIDDRMYVPTGLVAGAPNPQAYAPSAAMEVYSP